MLCAVDCGPRLLSKRRTKTANPLDRHDPSGDRLRRSGSFLHRRRAVADDWSELGDDMFRILIPAVMVIGIALISRPATAHPLSLVTSLPVIAALLGLAVLGAAIYLPRREARRDSTAPREDRHYLRLQHAQPTADSSRIEVVVVFSYTDPLSYELEPLLSRWYVEYRDTVDRVRLPVVVTERQRFLARAFFAARTLGVTHRLHGALFDALHVAKRNLDDEDQVARFFSDQGVDPTDCRNAFHSSAVQTALHKAEVLNRGYEIDTTPAVIVNGTFKITPQSAGSLPRLLEILDHLIATTRKPMQDSQGAGDPTSFGAVDRKRRSGSDSATPPGTTRSRS